LSYQIDVNYIYDEEDRISKVTQGDRSVGFEYGEFDDLTGLTHNGFSYNYTYDGFGNILTASIAGEVICTNVYAENNGSHVKSIYPDGTETGTVYDKYGNVLSNSIGDMEICSYVYDKEGNVAKKTDIQADVTTLYEYNDAGLLVRSEAYKGTDTKSEDFESKMQYTYTQTGKVGTLSYKEKDKGVKTYTYTYTKDDKPLKSTLPDKSHTDWSYDSLRRNVKAVYTPKESAADGNKLYTTLTYAEPSGMLLDEKDTTKLHHKQD